MNKNYQKIFHQIIQLFSQNSKCQRLFKKAESLYLMRSYKITSISLQQATQSYDRLSNKYSFFLWRYETKQLEIEPNDWHKNERKLFIWYLICYCQQKNESIQEIDESEWIEMTHIFFNKNVLFLKFQGLSILKNTKRHNWIQQDDELLKKNVMEIGSNQWNTVSKLIFLENQSGKFISSKQCRQRWFNHICDETNKREWSKEQDLLLLKLSLDLGKKWSIIARSLNTHRTQHMVKNRFNSILNKIKKEKYENEEILAKKLICILQEKQSLEGDQNQREQKDQEIVKKSILKKKQIKVDFKNSQKQRDSKNYVSEGNLKDLKQFGNKRQKGYFAFNSEQVFPGNQHFETGPSFSMTPSVKAISPAFSTHFYNFEGFFKNNQKRRQDGSSFFSPAPPCYSPAVNYLPSFSPSTDMICRFDGVRQKQQKSKDFQIPILPSQLSCEYQKIMNIKKQANQ